MSRSADRQAVKLLLGVFESREMCVSAYAQGRYADAAERLSSWHLIRPKGHELVATLPDDTPVALQWSPSAGAHGYFDECEGWVAVEAGAVSKYYVDVDRFFTVLTGKLSLTGQRTPQVENHLWQLGAFDRQGRSSKNVIWIGRRLSDKTAWARAKHCLRASPPGQSNILLVTTSLDRFDLNLPRTTILAVADVISPERPTIEPSLLSSSLVGLSAGHDRELVVLAGGKEVHFKGHVFRFRGLKQREIIGRLYEYSGEGERWVSSAKILEDLGYDSAARIRDVFKKNEAWNLLLTEKNGSCGFCWES